MCTRSHEAERDDASLNEIRFSGGCCFVHLMVNCSLWMAGFDLWLKTRHVNVNFMRQTKYLAGLCLCEDIALALLTCVSSFFCFSSLPIRSLACPKAGGQNTWFVIIWVFFRSYGVVLCSDLFANAHFFKIYIFFCFTTSYCQSYHISHRVLVILDPFDSQTSQSQSTIQSADRQFPHFVAQNGCDTHCEAIHFHSSQSFHFHSMTARSDSGESHKCHSTPSSCQSRRSDGPKQEIKCAQHVVHNKKWQHNAQVFDWIKDYHKVLVRIVNNETWTTYFTIYKVAMIKH